MQTLLQGFSWQGCHSQRGNLCNVCMLYLPSHAYQVSITTLEIGYSDNVLSARAVLIHGRASRLRASLGPST